MIQVAVIEDNPDLRDDLVFTLSHQGLTVAGFGLGAEFDRALVSGASFHVLVLDLGLPGESGLSLARRLRRSHPDLGIVMLTARSSLADRIRGLSDGADLYLNKPADMGELAASIRAVARRVVRPTPAEVVWRLDGVGMHVTRPDGVSIPISLQENLLLRCLCSAPGHFASRRELIAALGKDEVSYDERTLEVTLSRLRRKLGAEAPLKALRGKGYKFTAPLRRV
jgi:DNA-binding response OmpR family regulator